jgi:hypothetical protein
MNNSEKIGQKIASYATKVISLSEELENLEYEIWQKTDFPFGLPGSVYIEVASNIEIACIELMLRLEPLISVAVSDFNLPSNRDALIEDVVEGLAIVPSNQEATRLYVELNNLVGRAQIIIGSDQEEQTILPSDQGDFEDTIGSKALEYAKLTQDLFQRYERSLTTTEALLDITRETSEDIERELRIIISRVEEIIEFLKKNQRKLDDNKVSIAKLQRLRKGASEHLGYILFLKKYFEDSTDDEEDSDGLDPDVFA